MSHLGRDRPHARRGVEVLHSETPLETPLEGGTASKGSETNERFLDLIDELLDSQAAHLRTKDRRSAMSPAEPQRTSRSSGSSEVAGSFCHTYTQQHTNTHTHNTQHTNTAHTHAEAHTQNTQTHTQHTHMQRHTHTHTQHTGSIVSPRHCGSAPQSGFGP